MCARRLEKGGGRPWKWRCAHNSENKKEGLQTKMAQQARFHVAELQVQEYIFSTQEEVCFLTQIETTSSQLVFIEGHRQVQK